MSSLAEDSLSQLRRLPVPRPTLLAGAVFMTAAVILCGLAGNVITPHDPNAQDVLVGTAGPSHLHWLGTDDLGRDVLSRLIVGSRSAILGPVLIAVGAMLFGNAIGLVAGYFGGLTDAIIMRWVDLMYALPGLLVAIVVLGTIGGGYWVAVAVLVVLTIPYDTRLIRGATLEQRSLPYVEAAQALGLGRRRIMFWHIWPNLLPIVVANTFLNFAFALVNLAALSFLGLGAPPGSSDWGRMLSENRTLVFDNPVAALAAGLMIVVTAASVNLIGDGMYEWLSDRGRVR